MTMPFENADGPLFLNAARHRVRGCAGTRKGNTAASQLFKSNPFIDPPQTV